MAGPSDDRGFSLVELMVAVLIISVLVLVGLPSLMGARESANDRAVQANVRNAFAATRIYYNEHLRYSADPSEMAPVEPSVTWTNAVLTDASPARSVRILVYDEPDPGQTVVVAARTKTGHCFYLRDVMGGATAGTYFTADVSRAASCPEPSPAAITDKNWAR